MARSRLDGALWARIAKRGGTDPSVAGQDAQFLIVDPDSGALVVTGAGAAATATALRVQDGDTTRTAVVGEDRALLVRDVTAAEAKVASTQEPAALLLADEEFIGPWEDVLPYAAISVAIVTDQPSATGGAVVEFSEDAVSVIRAVPTTIPANFGAYFALAPEARYVRFRYKNGPTAQGLLRVQVLYRFQPPAVVEQPLAAGLTDANLATVTRAVQAARNDDGTYSAIRRTADGRMRVENQHAQPLTDAALRAAPVPVDTGLVTQTNALTDAQLRAADVQVNDDRLTFTTTGRLRVQSVEPRWRVAFGEVSVPSSAWTTVCEVTPAEEFGVVGYNADVAALTNIAYRQRLVALDALGVVTATYHVSTTNSNAVSWIPVAVTLPAGTRVALQAFHGELAGQTFTGTLNWRERN